VKIIERYLSWITRTLYAVILSILDQDRDIVGCCCSRRHTHSA